LNAVVVDLESPTSGATLTHLQEIGANLLLAELVRRSTIMGGKTADGIDVDGMSSC